MHDDAEKQIEDIRGKAITVGSISLVVWFFSVALLAGSFVAVGDSSTYVELGALALGVVLFSLSVSVLAGVVGYHICVASYEEAYVRLSSFFAASRDVVPMDDWEA